MAEDRLRDTRVAVLADPKLREYKVVGGLDTFAKRSSWPNFFSSLVARLDDFAPWYQAETVLVLARAALRLGHPSEARTLTADAERFVRETPDSPVLRDWIEESRAQLGAVAQSAEKAWTLTSAELRVLRLLPTHLSFPAIANSLYVSPNTVKTHVRAVYRKLDASSRAEAVALALDAGLLEAQRAA